MATMVFSIFFALWVSLPWISSACAQAPSASSSSAPRRFALGARLKSREPGAVVARIGSTEIRQAEVVAAVQALPPLERASLQDPAALRWFVKRLVREKILARAARKEGLHQSASVRSKIDRILANEYRRFRACEAVKPTKAEIKQYYEDHLEDFTVPEKVRVLGIVFESRSEAQSVLPAAVGTKLWEFRRLVEKHSVDRKSRKRGGSLGWVFEGAVADPAVVVQAFKLSRPGEVSRKVVEGLDGRFYILRFQAKKEPEQRRLPLVRSAIEGRIIFEAQNKELERLTIEQAKSQGLVWQPWIKNLRWVGGKKRSP